MNMTDPIADMLTRIRNAVMARHTRVLDPGLEYEDRDRADPQGGRLHQRLRCRRRTTRKGTIRITLRYVDKQPGADAAQACQQAGPACLHPARRHPARARRPGHGHHFDAAGRHDAAARPTSAAWAAKSSATSGKGRKRMSRIGRGADHVPAGVKVDVADGNVVTVTGPKGHAVAHVPADR